MIVLILFTCLLMIYQVSEVPLTGFFSLEDIFAGLKSSFVKTRAKVFQYFKDKEEMAERLRQLQDELESLKIRIQETESLRKENIRLKKLLRLTGPSTTRYTAAKVLVHVGTRFTRHLIIDKGSNYGLKKDMPVRSTNGLVGKIYKINPDFSVVLPVTDINFSVAVETERTGASGVLSGGGFGPCKLKYISTEEDIKVGDRVITSGIDGVFPEGIPVGIITKVTPTEGLFYEVEVAPFAPPEKTKEVVVLVR